MGLLNHVGDVYLSIHDFTEFPSVVSLQKTKDMIVSVGVLLIQTWLMISTSPSFYFFRQPSHSAMSERNETVELGAYVYFLLLQPKVPRSYKPSYSIKTERSNAHLFSALNGSIENRIGVLAACDVEFVTESNHPNIGLQKTGVANLHKKEAGKRKAVANNFSVQTLREFDSPRYVSLQWF